MGNFGDSLPLFDEGLTAHSTPTWPNGQPSLAYDVTLDATPNIDYNVNTFAQQSDLDDAETNDYTYIQLDEGNIMADFLEVEVYHGMTLVDSFSVEG